jgi:hypothetical protein
VHYRGASDHREATSFEAYYPAPLDSWYEVRAWPSPGRAVGLLHRHHRRAGGAGRAAARAARAQLVADVTTDLSDTLGRRAGGRPARRAAGAGARRLRLVTLVDEQGDLRDVGWAHADPELQEVRRRYAELRLDSLKPTSYVATTLRTGQPTLLTHDVTRRLAAVFEPGEARELLLRLRRRRSRSCPCRPADAPSGC